MVGNDQTITQDQHAAAVMQELSRQKRAAKNEHIAEIQRYLEIIKLDSEVLEIRALGVPWGSGRGRSNQSAYFRDPAIGAKLVTQIEATNPVGIYVTMNPVQPAAFARAPHDIIDNKDGCTKNAEILRRKWLLIDCDPDRPVKDVPATEKEKQAAEKLSSKVCIFLQEQGWPDPLYGDSGNGYALLYRIDLPNDDEAGELIKRIYAAVNHNTAWFKAGEETAAVDVVNHNAGRITRLLGTWNRKSHGGDPDRPHRKSAILNLAPDKPFDVVTLDQLQHVAAMAPADKKKVSPSPSRNGSSRPRLLMDQWLADRGVMVRTSKSIANGRDMWILEQCPFDPTHGKASEVAFFQDSDGKPGFECKHNGCSGNHWHEASQQIGRPDNHHYDPPLRTKTKPTAPAAKQPAATLSKPPNASTQTTANQTAADGEAPPATAEEPQRRVLRVVDAATFAATEYKIEYHIAGILAAGQPAICGGRSKTLKTSILTDLAISVATGTPFLGKYETKKSTVAFLSGESGEAAIQNTARRVCAAKNVNLADASMYFGFDLPSLSDDEDLAAMCDMIVACDAQLIVVDPIYLCLMGGAGGRQASNVFDMGPLLLRLTDLGRQTDSTILLCHHFRKNPGDPRERHEPPELEELSMAGFAEWARQWLLIGRREKYVNESGEHRLWLQVGGSAGHQTCIALDVAEGRSDDPGGRRWEVTTSNQHEAREERDRDRGKRTKEKQEAKLFEQSQQVVQWLRQHSGGLSKSQLSDMAGISRGALGKILLELKQRDEIESIEGRSGRQKCEIWRWKNEDRKENNTKPDKPDKPD